MFNLLGSGATRMSTGAGATVPLDTSQMTAADLDALPGELARRGRVARLAAAMRHLHAEEMRRMDRLDDDENVGPGSNDARNRQRSPEDELDADPFSASSSPQQGQAQQASPLRFHATGWRRDADKTAHAGSVARSTRSQKTNNVVFGRSRVLVDAPAVEQQLQQHQHQQQLTPQRSGSALALVVAGSPGTALRSPANRVAAPPSVTTTSPSRSVPARAAAGAQSPQQQQGQQRHWSERGRQRHIADAMEQRAFAKAQIAFDREMARLQRRYERKRLKAGGANVGNDDDAGDLSSGTDSAGDDGADAGQKGSKSTQQIASANKKDGGGGASFGGKEQLSFPGATEAERFRNAAISLRSINLQLKRQFETRYRSKLSDDTDDAAGAGADLADQQTLDSAARAGVDLDMKSRQLAEAQRLHRQAALDAELLTGEVLRANATIERYKTHIESITEQLEQLREENSNYKKQLQHAASLRGSQHFGSGRFGSWRQLSASAGGAGTPSESGLSFRLGDTVGRAGSSLPAKAGSSTPPSQQAVSPLGSPVTEAIYVDTDAVMRLAAASRTQRLSPEELGKNNRGSGGGDGGSTGDLPLPDSIQLRGEASTARGSTATVPALSGDAFEAKLADEAMSHE